MRADTKVEQRAGRWVKWSVESWEPLTAVTMAARWAVYWAGSSVE